MIFAKTEIRVWLLIPIIQVFKRLRHEAILELKNRLGYRVSLLAPTAPKKTPPTSRKVNKCSKSMGIKILMLIFHVIIKKVYSCQSPWVDNAQVQTRECSSTEKGRLSQSCIPNQEAICNWCLVGNGKSVFSSAVTLGILTIAGPYSKVVGQHKPDLMFWGFVWVFVWGLFVCFKYFCFIVFYFLFCLFEKEHDIGWVGR